MQVSQCDGRHRHQLVWNRDQRVPVVIVCWVWFVAALLAVMGLLVSLWNDWFLSVICLAVAALIPVVYLVLKSTTKRPTFLEPNLFKELPLIDKKVLSYNTRLFRCRPRLPPCVCHAYLPHQVTVNQ